MIHTPERMLGGEHPVQRGTRAGLATVEAGPDDGALALLLPGYASSKEDYLPVMPGLASAGFRVVAVDQRGQFESPGPDDDGAYTLEAFASDVHLLTEELGGGPVHLVGHSFGGLVARESVIADATSIASLTLLASGPSAITGPRKVAMRAIGMVYKRAGIAGVWAAIRVADTTPYSPEALAFLERRFFANNETCLRSIGDLLMGEPDRVGDLAAAASARDLPILVAHGADDDAWSPDTQADMARRLDARYAVIPGARHSPAQENPDALVEALVDFWRQAAERQAA